LNRVLHRAGAIARIPFRVDFQVLRLTWATHSSGFGATPVDTEAVLRHKSGEIHLVYVRPQRDKMLSVMDALAEAVAKDLPNGPIKIDPLEVLLMPPSLRDETYELSDEEQERLERYTEMES
jgi:hypothetical protein